MSHAAVCLAAAPPIARCRPGTRCLPSPTFTCTPATCCSTSAWPTTPRTGSWSLTCPASHVRGAGEGVGGGVAHGCMCVGVSEEGGEDEVLSSGCGLLRCRLGAVAAACSTFPTCNIGCAAALPAVSMAAAPVVCLLPDNVLHCPLTCCTAALLPAGHYAASGRLWADLVRHRAAAADVETAADPCAGQLCNCLHMTGIWCACRQ